MESIRRIMVAIDFSEQADRATALGLALANACGAWLSVLHVVHDLQSFPGVFVVQMSLEELQARLEAEARVLAEALCPVTIVPPTCAGMGRSQEHASEGS